MPSRYRDKQYAGRSELEAIHRSEGILDGYQRRLLGMIEEKIRRHPQRYDRDNYLQTASFLILSNSPSAQRLAFCGIPSATNPSSSPVLPILLLEGSYCCSIDVCSQLSPRHLALSHGQLYRGRRVYGQRRI